MNPELVKEVARLNRDMGRIIGGGAIRTTIEAESPIRIHSREIDSGGAPAWHPSFEKWIGAEEETGRPRRFRPTNHQMHPNRMKRALRQLRQIDAKAHEVVGLMTRGYTWSEARTKMNDDNLRRGQPPYSESDFLCLAISGSSLFLAAY